VTPPCSNCHGSRLDHPPLSSPERLSKDLDSPALKLDCSAEKLWPEWLKGNFSSELSALPWWTRSNYEKTAQAKAKEEGAPYPGFRIDIGEAKLDAHLLPKGFDFPVHLGAGKFYDDTSRIFITTDASSEINAHLEIHQNKIPLLMRGLMDFKGLNIGLGSSLLFETTPGRVSVGNLGDLHFIIDPKKTAKGAIDLVTPFMTPAMPVGYDMPYGNENIDSRCYSPTEEEAKELDCPPMPAWIHPDRSSAERDLVLTSALPPELKSAAGRLPKALDVEDLILRIFKLKERTKDLPKNPNPAVDLKEILSLAHLQEGSSITLTIDELKDFFLPGLLDLGASSLKVNLSMEKDQVFRVSAKDFSLNLDPMDYSSKKTLGRTEGDTCTAATEASPERPGIQLQFGNISPGYASTSRTGKTLEPGIQARFHVDTKTLEVEGNLALDADLNLPGLGDVHVSAQVLVETSLIFTDDGPKLLPRTTTLEIKNLHILRAKQPAVLTDGKIFLSDDERVDPLRLSGPFDTKARAKFEISGRVMETHDLDWKGQIVLPRNGDGSYAFSLDAFLENLQVDSVLRDTIDDAKGKSQTYVAKTQLNGKPTVTHAQTGNFFLELLGDLEKTLPLPEKAKAGPPFTPMQSAVLFAELTRVNKNLSANPKVKPALETFLKENYPTQAAAAKLLVLLKGGDGRLVFSEGEVKLENKVVEGARIALEKDRTVCTDHWDLEIAADRLQVGKSPQGPISLKDISAIFRADSVKLSPEVSEITLPKFEIKLNPKGNDEGLLQGPISLIQTPGKTIRFSWNAPEKHLLIKDLDWSLNAQQIYALPPKFLKNLDPRIRSVGVDGFLQADLGFSFLGPREKWHGEGRLALQGDSEGDVYFLDEAGRRVGNPVVRGTSWNFYKANTINWKRGYALGNFYLTTIFDLGALTYFSGGSKLPTVVGSDDFVNGLGPYELRFTMPYDNMPMTPKGFQNRIEDYIRQICRQVPSCVESLSGGKP